MEKEKYLEDPKFKKIEPFKEKVFRYLYNRDNQRKSSIYKGFAA